MRTPHLGANTFIFMQFSAKMLPSRIGTPWEILDLPLVFILQTVDIPINHWWLVRATYVVYGCLLGRYFLEGKQEWCAHQYARCSRATSGNCYSLIFCQLCYKLYTGSNLFVPVDILNHILT